MSKPEFEDSYIKMGAQKLMKLVQRHEAMQRQGMMSLNVALLKSMISTAFFYKAMDYALKHDMLYITNTYTPPYEPLVSTHPPETDASPFQLQLEEIEYL